MKTRYVEVSDGYGFTAKSNEAVNIRGTFQEAYRYYAFRYQGEDEYVGIVHPDYDEVIEVPSEYVTYLDTQVF